MITWVQKLLDFSTAGELFAFCVKLGLLPFGALRVINICPRLWHGAFCLKSILGTDPLIQLMLLCVQVLYIYSLDMIVMQLIRFIKIYSSRISYIQWDDVYTRVVAFLIMWVSLSFRFLWVSLDFFRFLQVSLLSHNCRHGPY